MEGDSIVSSVTCALCLEDFPTDILNHIRLIHPDVLEQKTEDEILTLRPVTQKMNDEDWVCESCDEQFELGQMFGEQFEGFYYGTPIVSLVCGECFMTVA
jgi:hypothetical protein